MTGGPITGGNQRRAWTNLFELTNLSGITVEYGLLEVQGLPLGDDHEKNLGELAKAVSYETRQAVALLRKGQASFLAVPAMGRMPKLERRLTPHVATLVPQEKVYKLEFDKLVPETANIAAAFLQFYLRSPLRDNRNLWGIGRSWYSKRPLNSADQRAAVDIYPGFAWNIVGDQNGRLFVAVDTVTRYIDRAWFKDRLNGGDASSYRGRHCLYCFGHQWYMVQFWGLSGNSITQQRFQPEGEDRVVDVASYTHEKCGGNTIPWIRDLDPNSPAIIYRYPGNAKQRYGAAGLCKLAIPTAAGNLGGIHGTSIMDPATRFKRVKEFVLQHLQGAKIGDCPIQIAIEPLEVEKRTFLIPAQRFGNGRILSVFPIPNANGNAEVVSLDRLGQRRLQLLLDPTVGPLDKSPFDTQYLLVPMSSSRDINEDFERRFVDAMRQVSGQPNYNIRRVVYDDRNASSLYRQVQAIKTSLAQAGVKRGYALLVLPEKAKRDLHNYIKRELWPDLQFQCANAGKIRSFYSACGGEPAYRPTQGKEGKLRSYVRNCALSMMVVNRKWGWALEQPLHYDAYIGIDVLNGLAGFTFVYNRAGRIFFRDYPCKQKERLSAAQLREVLVKHLEEDLGTLELKPNSIIIHRDGRTFPSELSGFHSAVGILKDRGVLPTNVLAGVVDIRKSTVDHLRIVEGTKLEDVQNPTIGSYYALSKSEGIVATTGWPFQFPGTANPLHAVIVEGQLDITRVLEDILALSQPVFTAPDKCSRLPLTIKLTDDFLEPIAADVDEEQVLYETEEELLGDGDMDAVGVGEVSTSGGSQRTEGGVQA